jgi:hypothetical protein
MREYCIPQPQRVRKIEKSFAWIDHRLLRNGFLPVMTHEDQALYLFLLLVADRNGVSFYRKEKICDVLGLDWGPFEVARDRLINLGLIAFEPYSGLTPNGYYQVLPVDGQPPDFGRMAAEPLRSSTPSTNRRSAPPSHHDRKPPADAVAWARS